MWTSSGDCWKPSSHSGRIWRCGRWTPAAPSTPSTGSAFRDHVGVDDDTWARGRGWALAMALVQLPYYRSTNEVISANARYVIEQVLADAE